MSDTEAMDKGAGRGRGRFTEKGVQATQAADIEALKALVADYGARLDRLEGEGADTGDPETPEPTPEPEEPPEPDDGEEEAPA